MLEIIRKILMEALERLGDVKSYVAETVDQLIANILNTFGYFDGKEALTRDYKETHGLKTTITSWHGEDITMQEHFKRDALPNIDNLITETDTNFTAVKENNDMPPKYSDGSFRDLPSGKKEYRFMFNGKQCSVTDYTEQLCFDKRTELIAGKPATGKVQKTKALTLGDWLVKWYKMYKIRKNGSKINPANEKHIARIKQHSIGKKPLNRLLNIDLTEYLKDFDDRTNTRQKIYTLLNEALEMAVANQPITGLKFNPIAAIKLERHVPQSYNVLQPKMQNLLLVEVKEPKYLALFWLLCCTGARITEGVNAIPHIDYENCIFEIVDEDTRTKKHKRKIPFLPRLISEEQKELLETITVNGAQSYFKKLFKKLDLKIVIHSFRHTFASCAKHVGFTDKQIQIWLGHSTQETTTNIYIDLLENEKSLIIDYFRELKAYLNL
jgi:integrase